MKDLLDPPEVPPSLREQRAIGGRLVIPVGPNARDQQQLVRITRQPGMSRPEPPRQVIGGDTFLTKRTFNKNEDRSQGMKSQTHLSFLFVVLLLEAFSPRPGLAELPRDPFVEVSFPGHLPVALLAEAPGDPFRLYLVSGAGNLLRSDDGGDRFSAAGLAGLPEGTIAGILVHPLDADEIYLTSNPSTVELLAFRSADGGRSLTPFPLPPGSRALWIEPRPPYRLWASLGDRLAVQEKGQPWLERPEILPGNEELVIGSLAFDPHRPGHLLAGCDRSGLFESLDDGLTWARRLEALSAQAAFDPWLADQAWATTFNGGDSFLWRSADGGLTWLETPIANGGSLGLGFDPYRPGYLLLGVGPPRHSNRHSIRLSRDGGATWEELAFPIPDDQRYSLWTLRDGRWILTGGDGYFESRDAGASWQLREALPSQVVALAVDPEDPEHAWAADSSGVFRTTRGGASWQGVFAPDVPLGPNLVRLAADPEDNRVVFLAHSRAAAGPCVWRSTDRGRTFSEAVAAPGEVVLTSFVIGRVGDLSFVLAQFYTAAGTVLWRSTDHGASWRQHPIASPGGLAVDPKTGVVYQPTGSELRQSLDGGLSFTPIADFSSWGAAPLRVVAGPGGPLYVLAAKTDYPADLQLFELQPGRGPVESRLPGAGAGDCYSFAIGVLEAGARPGQIYLSQHCGADGEQLWESGDGGRSWQSIWRGPPKGELRALVAAKDGESIWLVPADFGIYRARVAGEERLYLQRRRFAITAQASSSMGESSRGIPYFLSDQTGYFSFGSPARVDLAVKILDGRPLTGAFWIFAASLSESSFDLEVRDLPSGEVKHFHHSAGSFASFADFGALADPAPDLLPMLAASPEAATLAGGRFEAAVDFRDFDRGFSGTGQPLRLGDDTVSFSFFWPANVELIVRIADGRQKNGHYWVSFASLTNVEYSLTIRDTETGRVWTRHNPLGSFASGIDIAAFPEPAAGLR